MCKNINNTWIQRRSKIQIITDDLSRFDKGSILYIDDKQINVDNFREFKDMGLLSFNGITNINDVLEYVGKTIYVDSDMYEDDSIYYDDLIGCNVYDGDVLIGKVTDIMDVPQGAILCIDNKILNKESLVPYVDEFIIDVDIDEKKIIIKSIEGLL